MTPPEYVIEIEDLSFAYGNRPILEGINLRVKERDFLAIIGPNGGGKTTLVRLILGLLTPQKGTIRV
ncbi:MAG: ATP-binding cassette domain-containing protein, partial [Desulfatiglandales bacterium]